MNMPKPSPEPPPVEPPKKKRSPEYVALGLYKRANAIDEAVASLNLKLREKHAEQVAFGEEVRRHPADVQAVYLRLRPAPTPTTPPMQEAAKKAGES